MATISSPRIDQDQSHPIRNAESSASRSETNGQPPTSSNDLSKPFVPPYWTEHQRSISNVSYCSVQTKVRRHLIALEDNTEAEVEESSSVWAKCVTIDEYVIIGSTRFGEWGPGTYVTWNCTVETLEGGPIKIIKRYSEFDDLRQRLVKKFPLSGGSLPPLPPKSFISKFRPKFLEKRKEGLCYFLNCVLLNPEFGGSRILKDWVFASL